MNFNINFKLLYVSVLSLSDVPLCATDKIVSIGVSLDETITVSCDIITHPLAR